MSAVQSNRVRWPDVILRQVMRRGLAIMCDLYFMLPQQRWILRGGSCLEEVTART